MIIPKPLREAVRLPICPVLTLGVMVALFCLTSLSASGASTLSVQAGADLADRATQVVLFLPGTMTVDVGDPVVAASLQAGAAAQAAQKVTAQTNADGSTTYLLIAGVGDGKTFEGARFGASTLTVHAGDSVTWTQPDLNAIHAITFLDNGRDVPSVIPDPKTGLATNPLVAAPAGGKVYSGTGYFNSGILVPVGLPPEAGPSSYTLTFGKPGTYRYECLVHDELGMKATIQVLAAVASLPHTGGAPLGIGLVVAGPGLALTGVGVVVRRRLA